MIFSDIHIGDSSVPILAFAIHNGHYLPPELEESCGIDASQRLQEEDPFTAGFAECFPNRIVLSTSRFAVDLNRNPDKCIYQKPEDAWGLPVRKTELSQELIATLHKAYETWYKIADHQVERLLARHNRLLLLDLHSYNHRRGGKQAEHDPQINNPDIIIGRNSNPPERYPLFEKLRELLDGQSFGCGKLDCRCDVKFPGGYFSRRMNSVWGNRIVCPAIEFKKIFMDEWSGELDIHAYNELKAIFHKAVLEWLPLVMEFNV